VAAFVVWVVNGSLRRGGREIQAFTVFVGRCAGGSAGYGSGESCVPMRTSDPADGRGVKCPVKWWWERGLQEGKKRKFWRGRNCARFVLKMGLGFQLGIHLGTHLRIGSYPHRDKISSENGIFGAISTPLIPKLTQLKKLLKFV
jgi:hypothetical protein